MHLNLNQQHAVAFVEGPCLVIAGAGSGKTGVITQKIRYLVNQCGYQPENIAAVTFTNKAAREMKKRVTQLLGEEKARPITMTTFHTLGLTIIKREHARLGLKKNFSLFDEVDQFSLLQEMTADRFKEDKILLKKLAHMIGDWKSRLITVDSAISESTSEDALVFARYYQQYDTYLKACNVLDFEDLILLPTLLLANERDVRTYWQDKFRYLLIDEYQDTNVSQYQLMKLLVEATQNFTVVGDDDQSIYSWRGAQPENLNILHHDFPQLRVIKLEQNYRSSGRILNVANKLIANNPHYFVKKLSAILPYGEPLQVITAADQEQETRKVVGQLMSHQFSHQTSYHDYAILYRGNHQARLFEKELLHHRIPYRISGSDSFFSRAEIKDILAYLRLITNPDDDRAFIRIVNIPKREIGLNTVQKLGEWAQKRNKSLFSASFDFGLQEYISSARNLNALSHFTQWVQVLIKMAQQDPIEAIDNLLHNIEYNDWLLAQSPHIKAAEARIKSVTTLIKWIKDMLTGNAIDEPLSLDQVVIRLTLKDIMDRNAEKNSGNEVNLMTLHAAKGLEFPYVFLVGMEEGLLPHQTSIDENNIEEERRLAYVGITRAQHMLWFSLCQARNYLGEKIPCKPSRFLLELPQDDLLWDIIATPQNEQERKETGLKNIANIRAQLAARQKSSRVN